MAVPKIESVGRARGQTLPSPAWAGPRALQLVAVAQNRVDALRLLQSCLGVAGGKPSLLPSPNHTPREMGKRGAWHSVYALGSMDDNGRRLGDRRQQGSLDLEAYFEFMLIMKY